MPHLPAAGRTRQTPVTSNQNFKMAPGRRSGVCGAWNGQIRNCLCLGLRQGDLFGLQALGTALHDEGHARAFIEGAIPAGFDGREMHEHIFAVVALDKSKTFSGVKPLYCTCLFHILSLLLFCYWYSNANSAQMDCDAPLSSDCDASSSDDSCSAKVPSSLSGDSFGSCLRSRRRASFSLCFSARATSF